MNIRENMTKLTFYLTRIKFLKLFIYNIPEESYIIFGDRLSHLYAPQREVLLAELEQVEPWVARALEKHTNRTEIHRYRT